MKKPGMCCAAAAALLATLGGCAADETSTARAPSAARAQHVTVSAREYKLDVSSDRALRPGFVRLTIRNDGRGEHGVELIRLRRKFSTPELLAAFENEDVRGLEALGGAVSVPPGRQWEMTVRLGAGDYALLDFGENGDRVNFRRGMFKRFRVAGRPRAAKQSRGRSARWRCGTSRSTCVSRDPSPVAARSRSRIAGARSTRSPWCASSAAIRRARSSA